MLAGKIDVKIANAVRAINNPNWDSSHPDIIIYRKALMVAQNRLCVYCSRTMKDEIGHREVEHILPKSKRPDKNFNEAIATKNEWDARRHTRGYQNFLYEPLNLALACKRCNSFKGSFDSLRNRAVAPIAYPNNSLDFEWVHPHFDSYQEHIEILEGLLYSPFQDSPKGKAVIKACGLDRAEQLTATLVEAYRATTRELTQEMITLVFSGDPFDSLAIAEALSARYKISDAQTLQGHLHNLQANVSAGSDELSACIKSIGIELGRNDAIYPPLDTLD